MISGYLRNNVLGLVAIFLALSGVGYAAGLKKNSVKSKQIKDGQVKLVDVAPGAVDGSKVAADAIDGSKVADRSLSGADLANGTITGTQVEEASLDIPEDGLDPAVVQRRIAADCSPGESIRAIAQDGTVTCQGGGGPPSGAAGGDLTGTYPSPQLGASVVGGPEVALDSLDANDLGTGSVTTAEVAGDSLGASDLAVNSVGTSELADSTVGTADIAPDVVGAPDIAPDAIGTSELGPDAVSSGNVADNTLGFEDIGADEIGASELAPDAVTSAAVVDNSMAAADLASNSVGSSELGAVTVQVRDDTLSGNENDTIEIACPAGATAISGGGGSGLFNNVNVLDSSPDDGTAEGPSDGETFTGWQMTYHNNNVASDTVVNTYAVCLG